MAQRKDSKILSVQVRLSELEFAVLKELCAEMWQNQSVLLRRLMWDEAKKVGVDVDRLKRELNQTKLPLGDSM